MFEFQRSGTSSSGRDTPAGKSGDDMIDGGCGEEVVEATEEAT